MVFSFTNTRTFFRHPTTVQGTINIHYRSIKIDLLLTRSIFLEPTVTFTFESNQLSDLEFI